MALAATVAEGLVDVVFQRETSEKSVRIVYELRRKVDSFSDQFADIIRVMRFTCLFQLRAEDYHRAHQSETKASARYRSSRQGFSLVEMLTTLAIISVMAVLSLPSIVSFSEANKLSAGGNELADLATLAHDYALSHNMVTALVGVTTSNAVPTAQYRAFVVMARDSSGNWSPVSKWTWLPDAVTMDSSSANTFLTFSGSNQQNFSLNLNGASVGSGYAYQLFFPDGRMDTSASSLLLRVVTTHNPANWYDLVFNPMTGTVKVNRP